MEQKDVFNEKNDGPGNAGEKYTWSGTHVPMEKK